MRTRHRAVHQSSAHARISEPRQPGTELVDALSRVAHQVSPEELLAGRQSGSYRAFCGAKFLVASMVDPGHGPCPRCVS